jgi:hypothetical protein
MRIGRVFVVAMLGFGVVAGLLVLAMPEVRSWPVPTIAWPLIVALLADLALLPLVRNGRIEPLTMNERAAGVIGSALIITAILAVA